MFYYFFLNQHRSSTHHVAGARPRRRTLSETKTHSIETEV